MRDLTEQVKTRYDTRQVAEQLGVKIAKRGRRMWKAHCFHPDGHNNGDRNPSLSLFPEGFKCHGCGVAGDVIQLYQDVTGQTFVDARAELAKRLGLKPDDYDFEAAPRREERRVVPVEVEKSRASTFQRIWRVVEPTELPDRAKQYLEARGISPAIAHAYGCRDWTQAKDEVLEILRSMSMEDYDRAGLLGSKGRIWAALRALNGNRTFDGLAFPVWHPDHTGAPIGVRWRLYKPWDGGPKSLAQPAGDPPMVQVPLGLKVLDRATSSTLYWWPHKTEGEPEKVVVLCEGETDWLSVAEAAQAIQLPLQVVPVGICTMSAGYPEGLVEFLVQANQIVMLFDRGEPQKQDDDRPLGYTVAANVAKMLTDRVGLAEARRRITCNILEDDDDANDWHHRGDLVPLLKRLIRG